MTVDPVRPVSALRQLLITRGAIKPFTPRPKRVVLRLDDRGKRAAARHQEEYWDDPWAFSSRPFYFPDPETWFEEQEYPRKEDAQ